MSAKERFKNILRNCSITGNPKSYFVNKHRGTLTPEQMDGIKSVSFALCKNGEVIKHFQARKSEYGICFYHDFLLENGLRPVTYVNDLDAQTLTHAIFESPYLVESYSGKYDMRWENEWRIRGKLSFTPDDVAFLIVPDEDYKEICDWCDDNLEVEKYLMPYILFPASVFSDPLEFMLSISELHHSAWQDVRVRGEMLMNFDDFHPLTEEDRRLMYSEIGEELHCLSLASIHEVYERKYIARFLKFIGGLNDETKKSNLFSAIRKASSNYNEPSAAVRDLIMHGYDQLFTVQLDRIRTDWEISYGFGEFAIDGE